MNIYHCKVQFNRNRAAVVEAIALAIFDDGICTGLLATEIGQAVLDRLQALRRAGEILK